MKSVIKLERKKTQAPEFLKIFELGSSYQIKPVILVYSNCQKAVKFILEFLHCNGMISGFRSSLGWVWLWKGKKSKNKENKSWIKCHSNNSLQIAI